MDTRRSFYLAAQREELWANHSDCISCADIPYVTPANDNEATKDRLLARCAAMLRQLVFLHCFNWPF
jgi:hypothetical protein